MALTELRPVRSWTFLAMSILILILFWRSARAEWLEWREGWLQRSGASPLSGAPEGGCGGWAGCACVCVEQTWAVAVDIEEDEAEAEADAEDGEFCHIVCLCVD